jgi:hypothetical protein
VMSPGQLERHETPDPVRSNTVGSRFHGVRQAGVGDRQAGVGDRLASGGRA